MDKLQKKLFRADLFYHLDGIVTAPTAYELHKKGVLDYIIQKKHTTLNEIAERFNANDGYLNVALRLLSSQGWLSYSSSENDGVLIEINDKSEMAFRHIYLYQEVVELIHFSGKYHKRKFEKEPFQMMEKIFNNYQNNYGLDLTIESPELVIKNQILKHIEGVLIGPTIVALGMTGLYHKYFLEASFRPDEFHQDVDSFSKLLDIFVSLGWFTRAADTYSFTEKGLFFARRASAYGVTVSYLPTFRKMDDLLFGNPNVLHELPAGAAEIHVDREMNVWGSGGAHSGYFNKIDEIIISLFNKPIDEQPRGIVDIGCGNGSFLIHLFNVIEKRTLRGTMLDEFPLFLVGADYNSEALKVTRSNLVQAEVWAKAIWGDIGRPDLLAKDLHEQYNIQLNELLNVRTFLDHNRIWSDPMTNTENRISQSTGAFASKGKRILNANIEDNLKEHLLKWAPYVKNFGLLVIELHTISPEQTAANLGKIASSAYDATHGFSDQYIVEKDVFQKIAKEAGIFTAESELAAFPKADMATVSIHLLKA